MKTLCIATRLYFFIPFFTRQRRVYQLVNNKIKFVLLTLCYSNIITPILTIIIVANSQFILYMIMQSIDHCEGNVLQLITLRQLIIVQLDIEYDMQLFHNFYR